jgi:predicted enzyme related to lactoylglutathione lyase
MPSCPASEPDDGRHRLHDRDDDGRRREDADAHGAGSQPRTEIPGMGAFAYFKDSEGNIVGLWESA